MQKRDYDKAIADCDQALAIDPKYADAYYNRGSAWHGKGDYDKAIDSYSQALAINSRYAYAYFGRGNAWFGKGNHDKAIADYNRALALNRKDASGYLNRGAALMNKGDFANAISDYSRALIINPEYVDAYNNLAWLLATCPGDKYRDGKRAVENASKACQLDDGKHWYCLGTLAAAYAESGDFEKAKEWQAKSIELAKADKSATDEDKAEAHSRLELYKQGKPYREELKK